ncbi:MAG: hypothetical protein HQ557_14350 [Bacteroidetes bacterium]|nr:hypothetical protein [Bacteroidota bacterium]
MSKKQAQDATSSIVGTIYQFYVALDSCFELLPGEKLFFEKYGDITISESKQFEIKNYSDNLTDMHENVWKTLKNWLRDDFDITEYKELILLTTQEFGVRTKFKNWHNLTPEEKESSLENMVETYFKRKKKDKDTIDLVEFVMAEDRKDKRLAILGKFKILDTSLKEIFFL